jgi:hypothetical protein
MAEAHTIEVDANPAPLSLGLSRVKFGNHGNKIIVVWQLRAYMYNNVCYSR